MQVKFTPINCEPAVVVESARRRRVVYDPTRPHETPGNATPASGWYRRERPRPAALPAAVYPAEKETRRVMVKGEMGGCGYEMLACAGLNGVRVGPEVVLYRAQCEIRRPHIAGLMNGRAVQPSATHVSNSTEYRNAGVAAGGLRPDSIPRPSESACAPPIRSSSPSGDTAANPELE